MEKFDVVIIGGGLSGIISAIELKKKNIKVCIVEAKDRIGKKILASGNGKCNILNSNLSIDKYNNLFPKYAIEKYNYNYLSNYYKNMGIILKEDDEKRVYPYSESSNTILNVLLENLNKLSVDIFSNEKVLKIEKKDKYIVKTDKKNIFADNIILASGSNATFGINSHTLLGDFGHKITKLKQTLVPIKTTRFRACSGVRAKVGLSLYIDNKKVFSKLGEILFKENALSGILAFEASTYISRYMVKNDIDDVDAYIDIDFMPDYTLTQVEKIFETSPLKNPLMGFMHKSLATLLIESNDVCFDVKNYKIKVEGLLGVDSAQVLSGGLDINDFDEKTMESKLSSNIYAIGEVLDVDGECGGYNLAFACASSLCASNHIIEKYVNKNK